MSSKIIKIPSVRSEGCETILEFIEKKYEMVPWVIHLSCSTPFLTGNVIGHIEDGDVKSFIKELEKVEQDRKGSCHLGYQQESSFAIKIESVDSVGHFEVSVEIESCRLTNSKHDTVDTLSISFEIEPSQLLQLLKELKEVYKTAVTANT